MKSALKNPQDTVKAIEQLHDENSILKKQIESLLKDKSKNLKATLKSEITAINGINFIAKKIDLEQNNIKDLAFELGNEIENLFFFVATSAANDKAMLTCYIAKNLVEEKGLDAGKVVRELGKLIHGGGGGQPFFATAGGKSPGGIPKVLERVKSYIE